MRIDGAIRPRRRLSMTSLIDVIFLLLLFFMLSSTFTRFAEIEIVAGRAGVATAEALPDVLVRLDDDRYLVNGVPLDEDTALGELVRLREEGAASAVLLVRGEVSSQMLVSALERIRRETGLALSVAR